MGNLNEQEGQSYYIAPATQGQAYMCQTQSQPGGGGGGGYQYTLSWNSLLVGLREGGREGGREGEGATVCDYRFHTVM